MKFLITATEGPGFDSVDQTVHVLEKIILPSLEALMKMESDKTILGGGLPVGERSVVFILTARSNDEVDQLLRRLPMWGTFAWKVTPLQNFDGRAQIERRIAQSIKKGPGTLETTRKLIRRRIRHQESPTPTLNRVE